MVMKTASLTLESVAAGDGTGLRFRGVNDAGLPLVLDSGAAAVAPSPMDALLLSLGACTAMDVISILRKKRLDVTGYELEVRGERAETHPKVFTTLEVVHRVRGRGIPLAAVEEAVHLSHGKYCSVSAMLQKSAPVTNRVEVVEEAAAV